MINLIFLTIQVLQCLLATSENQELNLDNIKFYAQRLNETGFTELKYGNETHLRNYFDGLTILEILFHGIGQSSKEPWVTISSLILAEDAKSKGVMLLVDYPDFVKTSTQAIKYVEPIADKVGQFLNWANSVLAKDQIGYSEYFGHGIGAYIGGRSIEKALEYSKNTFRVPDVFFALDPLVLSTDVLKGLPAGHPTPQITKNQATVVAVFHTTTCSHTPKIEACDSGSTVTIGDIDFFPNGGAVQTGCQASDQKCSHDRATDLFIDGMVSDQKFVSFICDNFEKFEAGNCPCKLQPQCPLMTLFTNLPKIPHGKYYLWTNGVKPFGRGPNQTRP